jgi:hypothetical protein
MREMMIEYVSWILQGKEAVMTVSVIFIAFCLYIFTQLLLVFSYILLLLPLSAQQNPVCQATMVF